MKTDVSRFLRVVFGNVWFLVCLLAAGSCFALALQLLLRIPPLDGPALTNRVVFGVPALFGGLAALYGMVITAVGSVRTDRRERLRARLRAARRRLGELESIRRSQRSRIEELSTLREVATVINQESDFSIIAEKVLELVDGLLEPLSTTLLLRTGDQGKAKAFAHYAEGTCRSGRRVRSVSIPQISLSAFESHSLICRLRNGKLQALVPLKVQERILGALLWIFPADPSEGVEQVDHFSRTHRRVLLEICRHISLAVKTKYLHTRAVVDGLTGLYSRSHFDRRLKAALDFARRNGEPFSLVLVDIDHFKHINDRHGHASGDLVLNRLAGRIQRILRKYDTAYRYGGEEIAVLLPGTNTRQAVEIAERLRNTVGSQRFRGNDGQLIEVTISLGVAQFESDDDGASIFERADKRLYRAKRNGRDRVVPTPAAAA